MLKKPSLLGKEAGRYLLIASMTGLLVGCGGSSGDAAEQDADLDGIPDSEDNFIDLDDDGFDDFTGFTEAQANGVTVVEVSALNPCGGENGTDNNSSTAGWEDNCVVKKASIGGQFARSLFSVGIQRVLYCSGFEADTDFPDYTGFADGIFGAKSETATIAFQKFESLTEDGIVGPQTWARLRERIVLLEEGEFDQTPDTYGFKDGACENIPLFFQDFSLADDGLSTEFGGWTLARNQPDVAVAIPFSYEEPFDRL